MPSTIQTIPITEPRIVIYSAGNSGSSIQLNYTNMSYSVRSVLMARQQLYKIYTITFRFVIGASTPSGVRDILTNCERTLMTRGGTLQVSEGGVIQLFCSPATGNPVVQASIPVVFGDPIRRTILTDVEHGPKPLNFSIEALMPLGAIASWTVQVTTAAEDAYWVRDNLVLGVDAEVSYSIDQNHYTRRTVSGRVVIAHFTRNGPTLQRSPLSQADMEALRANIIGGRVGQNFMDPVLIPPGFVRVTQNWGVDPTENTLIFEIVDQEVYRTYPAYITSMDATMSFSVSGASAIQYVSHLLEGYVEAPRDISKTRLFAAAFELIQESMPFITRRIKDRPSYVAAWRMVNHLYRNRLDFSVLAYTPMGAFDVLISCGVTRITSKPFFPQGPAGSAGLYGSAYRLQTPDRKEKTLGNDEVVEAKLEPFPDPSPVKESKKVAKSLKDAKNRLLFFNLRVYSNPKSNKRYVVSNSSSGTSENTESMSYMVKGAEFELILGTNYAYITDETDSDPPDFINLFTEELSSNIDLEVKDKKEIFSKVKSSAFGNKKMISECFIWRIFIKGELRKRIIEKGGIDEFSSYLQSEFRKGNFDDFGRALNDYISKGAQSQ